MRMARCRRCERRRPKARMAYEGWLSRFWQCLDVHACERAYEKRTRWYRRRAYGVFAFHDVRGPWTRARVRGDLCW